MTQYKKQAIRARVFQLILLTAISFVFACSSHAKRRNNFKPEFPPTSADTALRHALLNDDYESFRQQLALGGDPTRLFENSMQGWVLCAATAEGKERFLILVIESGFDVNYRQENISTRLSIPLSCAVAFENRRAMEILIAAGADPTATICISCNDRFPSSVMSSAAIASQFGNVIWLLDKGDYSIEQIETVVRILEHFPVPNASAVAYRDSHKLADILRERGFEVNLKSKEN